MKKYEIIWKVNYASLQCKNGVHSVEETDNIKDIGFIFNETMYGQIVSLDELISFAHYENIAAFLFNEFLSDFIDSSEIDDLEYYKTEIADGDYLLYERKMINNEGSEYFAYFESMNIGHDMSAQDNKIMKALDFTRKGIQ